MTKIRSSACVGMKMQRTTGDNSLFSMTDVKSLQCWNAKMRDNRFFSWWVSCFVIPLLRQLVFAKKVWLLAKWYGARNITIWLASSSAPMTHTHKRIMNLLPRSIPVIYHQLAQAGMQTWIHWHIHMQTHSWSRWIITALTPKAPCAPPTTDLCSHGGS